MHFHSDDHDGKPTDSKADLPILKSEDASTMVDTSKESTTKSESNDDTNNMTVSSEKELVRTKEDAIIESAEVVSYKMLIDVAEKAGIKDAIPALKQSLQQEEAILNWIMGNASMVLSILWPKIEVSAAREGETSIAA